MFNQKNVLALSILVIVVGMTGCQKTDPKNTDKSVDQSAASQVIDTSMLLQGDTEKLKWWK